MKRAIGILAGLAIAAAALAQAPFTIVRPADNARVREKVRVQIPKDSVPKGGYIGIFVGGKFVEAIVPDPKGKFYEYILDTKGRNIPDGNLKIEAVLYMDSETAAPKILDRSSVNVRVQNSASIKVPARGFLLRYGFAPGKEYTYKQISRTSTSVVSDAEVRNGFGRAAELPLDYEVIRLQYTVDQKYGNGDGLIRMQAIPPKGQDYVYYNAVLEGKDAETQLYMAEDLGSLYMRLTATGHEVFTSFPMYFPIEGGAPASADQVYVIRPLPTLPVKRVKPGDTWRSRFQMTNVPGINKLMETSKVVTPLPARGEFIGVEWEMGRPCAKIRNVIQANNRTFAGTRFGSTAKDADEKVTFEEVSWFALDKRMLVKSVVNLTLDRKVPQQQMQQGQPGGGAPSMIEGGGVPRGRPAGAGGGGSLGGGSGNDNNLLAQKGGLEGGPRGGRGNLGGLPAQGGQGRGGAGMGAGQGRGPAAGANQWQRIRAQVILVLEK